MSRRRTNGWDEEDDDWSKVKFDDDDEQDEDSKKSKFKFQIKLTPSVAVTNQTDAPHTTTESAESEQLKNTEGVVKLAPLLSLPKQQTSSMRGRRWDQQKENDEFEEITKRTSVSEIEQSKYTITSEDLEDNAKYVGIPAIVIHPFVPGVNEVNELQLNLGEAVLIFSTDIDRESGMDGESVWYYGRLLREHQGLVDNSKQQQVVRPKTGFFPSHFVFKLCEEFLSFETAKEVIKPASRGRVLFDRSAEFDQELELSLIRGEDVSIIHKQDNGWWIGKHSAGSSSPAIGFFPCNFVEEVPCTDDDLLLQDGDGRNGGAEGTLFDSSPFSDAADFDSMFGDKTDEWSSSVFISMAFTHADDQQSPQQLPPNTQPWSATIKWKPRDDVNENRRAVAIITFLDDEQLYLDSMRDFIEYYLHPVKETVRKETPSLSFHEINAMFTHFQQILDNHKILFGQLCKRVESVAEDGSLCILMGDVIRQTEWMHDLYVKYAVTCPLLVEAVKVAQQSPELQKFLQSRKGKSNKDIDLPELIERPLNHVVQFSSFVSRLNDATPKDHEDKKVTTEILATIETTVDVANATRRHSSSINPAVRHIYDTLHPKLLNLLSPTQSVISEGVLYQWIKPTDLISSSSAEELLDCFKQRRYLILNNVLLLTSPSPEAGSDCYGLKLHVTLSTTRAERAPLPGSILKEKWGIPFSSSTNDVVLSSSTTISPSYSILLHTPKKPILLFAADETQRQLILRFLEQ